MDSSSFGNHLARLRNYLAEVGLDGLIVPRTDAHKSENTAPHDECLHYVTGFTGSAGVALVRRDHALIFVDGRYQVQVRQEVDLGAFEVRHFHDDPLDCWLRTQAKADLRIGVDPMRVDCALHDRLDEACKAAGAELVGLDDDPFETVWPDRPEKPLGMIRAMPMALSGETSQSKRGRIAEKLREAGADLLIETLPDNIAWLLNVRGSDVPMNPVPHSFLTLDAEGEVKWFVDRRKLGNDLTAYELSDVAIAGPEQFLARAAETATGKNVLLDPEAAPFAVRARIADGGGKIVAQPSIITKTKAIKTQAELEGYRACHVEDGVALTNFLAWVTSEVGKRQGSGEPLTELDAEERLLAFRAERSGFLEPSFRSISAAGSNAAMCHYHAGPKTNAIIDAGSPYLIDSGGQYANGTTDVTRTLMLGKPSDEIRDAYTAVLKGFLSLSMARFPTGTEGHQLDAFARRALWDIGLDFDHGTGHGVGHNLLIHEHPHRFSKKASPHGFEPGVIMTIEPGYYKEGGFGMRIENQVEVVADRPGFCRFASLTLAPIDLGMARLNALSSEETAFLDAYHTEVRARLADLVLPGTLPYLMENTRACSDRQGN
ncbi:MAG: M24 family metallopeptidase [Rhizobiaceae bacterium]